MEYLSPGQICDRSARCVAELESLLAAKPLAKRLLAVRVKEAANGEALVATTEYWYLRWWGTHEQSYVYPYRETNHQLYVLRKEADSWRVYENLRPPPRSSIPSRWRQRRQR